MSEMQELIGKYIKSILINDDRILIKFITNEETICYGAMGGCCSESWFNHIEGIENVINSIILKTEQIPIKEGESSRQEVDEIYGIKLFTSKGTTLIEYRNSSNGYYGGWCELLKEPYQDEFSIRVNLNFKEITEDF